MQNYVTKQINKAIEKNNGKIPETVDVYNALPKSDGICPTLTTNSGNLGVSGSIAIIIWNKENEK